MRFIILPTFFAFTILLNGCAGSQTPTNSTNVNPAVVNTTKTNADNPLSTTKIAPEAATNNDAPTLASVVQNYYIALQKKDEAGARKFLSQSAIKYWQDEMKSEKMPSLLAVLEDDASPVEEKRELRNEKIDGDTATAEIKGGSAGVWTPIKFVKEGGEWKFASPKDNLALQDIPKTASSPAAAK